MSVSILSKQNSERPATMVWVGENLLDDLQDEVANLREVVAFLEAANQGFADENRLLRTQLAKAQALLDA